MKRGREGEDGGNGESAPGVRQAYDRTLSTSVIENRCAHLEAENALLRNLLVGKFREDDEFGYLMRGLLLNPTLHSGAASVEAATPSPRGNSLAGEPRKARRDKIQVVACAGNNCSLHPLVRGRIHVLPHSKTSVSFTWRQQPEAVLVVVKPGDPRTIDALQRCAEYFRAHHPNMRIFLERHVAEQVAPRGLAAPTFAVEPWDPGEESRKQVDLIVTLGGDGTVLWASGLFPKGVPPVLSFSMGTLGFLTLFPFEDHEKWLHFVTAAPNNTDGNEPAGALGLGQAAPLAPPAGAVALSLRNRMACKLHRAEGGAGGAESIGPLMVMNEVCLHRDQRTNLIDLDVYCDGIPVTKVQADGVIVSTPTGSTAYGMSAGGPIAHPATSAFVLTPICPHSLSFRPLLIPDVCALEIRVPRAQTHAAPSGPGAGGAEGKVWASFDGRHKCLLGEGDRVVIHMSPHPLPHVVMQSDVQDWFSSLKGMLHWNQPNEEVRVQPPT